MDGESRAWRDGAIAVDGGKVVAIGGAADLRHEGKREIHAAGGIILPGLVCAHTDLQQAPLRGLSEGVHAVRDRMYKLILPFGARSTRESARAGARLLLAEQL